MSLATVYWILAGLVIIFTYLPGGSDKNKRRKK